MAKKKKTFGKLLAFTTTAVAIGGTCYVFRDKIKQSSVYKAVSEKLSDLFGSISEKYSDDDDDFFFDEEDDDFEDAFSKDTEHGREYTSITINAKEDSSEEKDTVDFSEKNPSKQEAANSSEETSSKQEAANSLQADSSTEDDTPKSDETAATEDLIEIFPKDSISNIKVGNTSAPANSISGDNTSSTEENHYENEGLSDVSEDSDALEEQDKLDR